MGFGGRGPGPPPGKLQVVIYFQAETGTNFPREAPPPPPPHPLELSGSAHACLIHLPFLHVTGSAIILSSADAQADLRLYCLHATKSSFSQQGKYGMG